MLKKIENYGSMSYRDLIEPLGENDKDALKLLKNLYINNETANILCYLATIGIRGKDITRLYRDICGSDMVNFYFTCSMLSQGVFDDREIERNLAAESHIPFFDAEIESKDSLHFLFCRCAETDDTGLWKEFCDRQRKVYMDKYESQGSKKQDETGKAKTTE